MKQTIKILVAGCAVYVGMAACSAADTGSQRLAGAGGSSAGTASTGGTAGLPGGTGGGLLDSGLDAIADALTDPVGDADAAPSAVVTAQCDKKYRPVGAASDYFYAEAPMSGMTVADLAGATAMLEFDTETGPPGYLNRSTLVWARDGFVAADCSGGAVSARFTLP